MNKVILLGRLTKDPEVRYTQAAEPSAVARFTLAVNRRFKKEGEPDADFIGCVSFGKQGEFVEKYLKKGMQIGVTGRMNVRTYDDSAGQRKWITEVITEDIEFAESRSAFEARMAGSGGVPQENAFDREKPAPAAKPPAPFEPEGFAAITESIDDDDLPF
ncbi:MAG: single-stranded DNA-binding protein [Clostridiales bacterium]|jgi:single-strand DNA-binding protein|nr:single-stranded DNA-binding protein [Clostridiales bacterium]